MTDKILIDRAVVEQALKLLDALSYDENYDYDGCFQHWADYARPEKLALQFRAALEQPQVEQELAAEVGVIGWKNHLPNSGTVVHWTALMPPLGTKLYTHPQPPRQPLTDEQIARAWAVASGEHNASSSVKRRITRAIERAHGIGE